MRTAFAAVLLAGGLCLAAPAAAQPPSLAAYRAAAEQASKPTLVARYGADDLRLGHLRLPKGKGPFPVAVIIHGGCWSADIDTLNGVAAVADALTERGIATWSIEYRRIGDPGAGWPGTFEDISAGIDYLTVLAQTHPLDLNRVTIVGHSAGAHLALWGASRGKLGGRFEPKVKPMSVIAIDGPGTLAPYIGIDKQSCMGRSVIVPLMGGPPAEKPGEYALASPAEHLPLGMRQLLVQAALTDFMTPYAAAAKASGDPVEVLQASEDHFDVVTPATENGRRTIDFIVARAFAP